MPRYESADKELCQQVKAMLAQPQHSEAKAAGVTIHVVLAFGKNESPAIMHGGYQAAAQIRINNHRQRVEGLEDCTLIIDGDQLGEWSKAKLDALIDHELTHILVQRDGDGEVKYDDCERPKLKLRKHDAQIGVFFDVMERHEAEAIDTQVVAKLCQDTKVVAKLCQDTKKWIQPLLQLG